MPLVTIDIIKDVITREQKRAPIASVTNAMLAVEVEAMRELT